MYVQRALQAYLGTVEKVQSIMFLFFNKKKTLESGNQFVKKNIKVGLNNNFLKKLSKSP